MNKQERNAKTADAIFQNIMARFLDGQFVTIQEYLANPEVIELVKGKMSPAFAACVGFPKPVPADLERRLRERAKARENARYEYLRTA